jgi:hypothetical protein
MRLVAPAATAPTAVRSPATVFAATATVRTFTAIVPSAAIRVSASIHPVSAPIYTPIPAAGSTVILVAEQSIAPFPSGDLIANGFRGDAPFSEI